MSNRSSSQLGNDRGARPAADGARSDTENYQQSRAGLRNHDANGAVGVEVGGVECQVAKIELGCVDGPRASKRAGVGPVEQPEYVTFLERESIWIRQLKRRSRANLEASRDQQEV